MTRKGEATYLGLLICTLSLTGCTLFDKSDSQARDIKKTTADQEKARLLRQVDRKYEDPQAQFELGQLYQNDGLWARAEQHYLTALNFDPVHREAQAARVKVLLQMSENDKAELLADEYMGLASTSAAGSLKLAMAFQKQLLDEYALTCYRQALRLAPNSAVVNRQIGYYYLSRNDTERAKDYLSRSYRLDWNQPDVARELGRLLVPIEMTSGTQQHSRRPDRIAD
ncbi:MAG: tetratricopeptide repeat protein [Planctomycetota bacterium]|jgi:tetratricopeptide (TPR) repeat protein